MAPRDATTADQFGVPDFRPLFTGRDLSGFYTWLVDTRYADPRQVFTVTNGWLRISGDGLGCLATHESFTNYELLVEFNLVVGTRNTLRERALGPVQLA